MATTETIIKRQNVITSIILSGWVYVVGWKTEIYN